MHTVLLVLDHYYYSLRQGPDLPVLHVHAAVLARGSLQVRLARHGEPEEVEGGHQVGLEGTFQRRFKY